MKITLSIFTGILFLISNLTFAQEEKAKIEFEEMIHDFGEFKEEAGSQSFVFNFKNTGAVPLILNRVAPSCGCTTPEWNRKPIAPGGTGHIKVSYNPKNRPGTFNKSVRVNSNAENASVVIRIKGKVIPRQKTLAELYPSTIGPLRLKKKYISFTKQKNTETKTRTIELINDSEEEVTVGVKTTPSHITANVSPSVIKPKGKAILSVSYDASKKNTYGYVSESIYLNVNGKVDHSNRIGLSTNIEEDFSSLSEKDLRDAPVVEFDEKVFDFGKITQGDKVEHTFTLKNIGKNNLIIRRIKTSCGCTAVSPEKKVIKRNETVPLKVTFNSRGKMGRQNKSITIITNDPKNPTNILRISSTIVEK